MANQAADPSGAKHIVQSFDDDMNGLTSKIIQMGGFAERQVADAVEALVNRDIVSASRVIERDKEVDHFEEEIDQDVIRILATRQPMAVDLRIITMALKISNDLERTSDYAVSIAKRAQRLADHPEFAAMNQVRRISEQAIGMVKDVLDAFVDRDVQKATDVWNRDQELDRNYTSLFRELITYMLEDPRRISQCIDLLFIAKNLERIGDHATNIAEKINYMMLGSSINQPRRD